MLRPIHLIPENTKINFLKYKSIFLLGSLAMVIISLLASFIIGLNFGIDFRGGVLLELRSINGNAKQNCKSLVQTTIAKQKFKAHLQNTIATHICTTYMQKLNLQNNN